MLNDGGLRAKVVQLLLTAGALVNQPDKVGYTPLHYACYRGNKKIMELLCANGAKVDQRDQRGWSPLHVACGNTGDAKAVELLLRFNADPLLKVSGSDEENAGNIAYDFVKGVDRGRECATLLEEVMPVDYL
mmetsp:Transcript_64504/g.127416  ORF Transcript_64504/g.127416 Transcript_64504/m.127416 type:complete len:132 (-) Transcript_64504:368-763(-)